MDDLTRQQDNLEADVWARLARLDRAIASLRNALQAVGTGSSVTTMAIVIADESTGLLAAATKAEGFGDAVSRM